VEPEEVRQGVGVVYDYPSKDRHSVNVVYAPNIKQLHTQTLDETEQINMKFVDQAELLAMIKDNSFQVSSAMAALLLSFQTK
jgi:ABC-type phosphate transport system ATPase subunit